MGGVGVLGDIHRKYGKYDVEERQYVKMYRSFGKLKLFDMVHLLLNHNFAFCFYYQLFFINSNADTSNSLQCV